ncbi:MAG: hypothetical protein IJH84_11745 [Saccharopolyspora sp.]|nr:hypothetical protein [Saccharopolyspora sp.]MBQ6641690.1 hypothetical protein [Saccharopolyspora sp.]
MAERDPSQSPAALERSLQRGRRLDRWGSVAVLAGAVCLLADFQHDSIWLGALEFVVGFALVGVGVWALVRGRRHLTPVVPGLRFLPADARVVLYLRSFSDDRGFARMGGTRIRDVLQWPPTLADLRTEEQQVARGVAAFGRMVALGKPSDQLPQPGAERSYVADEQWQDEVLTGLDRAGLVLLAAGPGKGLEWEVDQVVRRDPARLVILVSRDRSQYAQFRESVHQYFPKGLPDYPQPRARHRLFRGRYVRAAIWFDPDWTPHLEMLDGKYPLSGAATRTQHALPRALRPVYERAGVPVPRKNRPTKPRPKEVVLGVVLFALPLPALVVTFCLLFYSAALGVVKFLVGPGGSSGGGGTYTSSGLLATGNPTLDFLIITLLVLLIWPLPVALWMRRVLRGGPVAILMLQVAGISQGIALLVSAIPLGIFFLIAGGLASLTFGVAPLWLGINTFVVNLAAPPIATLLFLRRDVREWAESRT